MMDITTLFRALANTDRLRIAAATCDRPSSIAELAAALRMPPATVARHVARLRQAGLLNQESVGRGARYRFQQRPLLDGLRQGATRSTGVTAPADLEAEERKILGDFLREGQLKAIPARQKKLLVVLRFLARAFEPGRAYPERAVNEALGAYYDDYATLRRALVDHGLMRREKGMYWRLS